jgi:phosphoenolpyruvate carboxylase
LGRALREQLASDIDTILGIRNTDKLMTNLPQIRASVDFRNAYVDPLNLLQAELLKRNRSRDDGCLDQAIMVTIAGISAGLRNTG